VTYRVVFIDHADVVAEYSREHDAREQLRAYVQAHPHLVDDLGIQAVDDGGRAVGPLISAEDVVGEQLHL
jgi:hypothetical protein